MIDPFEAMPKILQGQVTELRAFVPSGRGFSDTWSGYYDDYDRLVSDAAKLDAKGASGIYYVPDAVDQALLARCANNCRIVRRDPTTTNADIVRRRYLKIDCDPVRPSGISATDAEKSAALAKAAEVRDYLTVRGWPMPIEADSGNGAHLMYRIDLPADDDRLCERVTKALSARFSDDGVHIDEAVHNAARIWKMPGTTARKGDDTEDRPHRKSAILAIPDPLKVATYEHLSYLARDLTPDEKKPARRLVQTGPTDDDEIRTVLSYLRARPDHDDWIRVIAGTLDKCGGDKAAAESHLRAWMPEETEGEYAEKLANPLRRVTWGSVVHMAKAAGYDPKAWHREKRKTTNAAPKSTGTSNAPDDATTDADAILNVQKWIEGEIDLNRVDAIGLLAGLSRLDYDVVRKQAAERLGCRIGTLDDEVKRLRGEVEEESTLFEEPEPWDDPVDGSELLRSIKTTFQRYVAFPDEAATACALWTFHTYALDAAEASPILAITSPEKRCGKTTLLGVLSALAYRPAGGSAFTRAAVYRVVEKYHPTLLIDEADTTVFKQGSDSELRGIINSGHTRRMAHVWVCVGDDHEPTRFSTWAPKAIACIGTLPDTIADRSIEVRMRRKTSTDKVVRYRERAVAELADMRRMCKRWADENLDTLRLSDPDVPRELSDRAADSWATLLAIADVAGGEWPDEARHAALELSGSATVDTNTVQTDLLRDVHSIFAKAGHPESISSADILAGLHAMDERPWPTYHRGKELTARGLASLLKPFDVASKQIRFGTETLKGYERSAFDDVFPRYLPELSETSETSGKIGLDGSETHNSEKSYPKQSTARVSDKNGHNRPAQPGNGIVSDVSLKTGVGGENRVNDDWTDAMMSRADSDDYPF